MMVGRCKLTLAWKQPVSKDNSIHLNLVSELAPLHDGLCNCTKIYINDKLRGIADPFDIGQYVWQPFPNITGNLYESITIGTSHHIRRGSPPGPDFENSTVGGVEDDLSSNLYLTKDLSIPAAGQFAVYPADPLLLGRNPTQLYLPWKGNILEASVWFDNGRRQGIVYPSTCTRLPLTFWNSIEI